MTGSWSFATSPVKDPIKTSPSQPCLAALKVRRAAFPLCCQRRCADIPSHSAGRAEAALAALPTSSPTLPIAPYSFRPAGIAPIHPTPDAPAIYRYLNWLFPVVGALLPTAIIKTDVLARGMLEVALKGSSGAVPGWEGKGQPGNKGVFDSEEIKKLAKGSVLEGK